MGMAMWTCSLVEPIKRPGKFTSIKVTALFPGASLRLL